MITFQLKGDKHVIKQIGTHVQLIRPLQTDRHSIPLWNNGRLGKHVDVTRLKCERIDGDFDVVFFASPDVELSIDYQKGSDNIGFYYHKGVRAIGLFEHDTNTFITEIKIPKGSKRPINFDLSGLAYKRGAGTGETYYQNFYEFWKKAYDYAEDFGLSGLLMDAGDLTSAVIDEYDCNIVNRGEGFDQFDFNTGGASLAATPSPNPDPQPEQSETEQEQEQQQEQQQEEQQQQEQQEEESTPPADTTPPTVSLSSSSTSLGIGQTATITATLSETSTTFTAADITATGGTLSNFTAVSSTSYTVVFTPLTNSSTNGVITVAAGSFSDTAGNANTAGAQLTLSVDTTVTTTTYTVTVVNVNLGYGNTANRYYINGQQRPTLSLSEGQIYRFDQSDSTNSNHPLRLSVTADGTHGGGVEYTTGVTVSGNVLEITVPIGAPTLYYYCTNHSGMGGTLNT